MALYDVWIDGTSSQVEAESLAEVTNKIRGTGKWFKVWSPLGVQLIDTMFGDTYGLLNGAPKAILDTAKRLSKEDLAMLIEALKKL